MGKNASKDLRRKRAIDNRSNRIADYKRSIAQLDKLANHSNRQIRINALAQQMRLVKPK